MVKCTLKTPNHLQPFTKQTKINKSCTYVSVKKIMYLSYMPRKVDLEFNLVHCDIRNIKCRFLIVSKVT